jgi:CRP-like cAMP-binding protein
MSIRIKDECMPPTERCDGGARSGAPRLRQADGPLGDCSFFSSLDDRELECLFEAAETLRIETGETVFRRGDPGDTALLVLAGSVAVEADRSSGDSVVVSVLEPGELVGEMAVLDGTTRSATVTALEPCELLAIPQSEILALLVNHPGMAIRMLGMLTARLRRLTDLVGDAIA